jgi:Rrf2 family protein
MKKLNRKVEYALMALRHMSHKVPGELTSAKEVADSYSTPFDATARVMQIMAQRGWLKAEHGAFGGYVLTKDLAKLSLLDLMGAVQGPEPMAKCLHDKSNCELESNCNIISPIRTLNAKLNDFYRGVSLKELLFPKAKEMSDQHV